MTNKLRLLLSFVVAISFAASAQTSGTRAADEARIRQVSERWGRAALNRDLDKTVSFEDMTAAEQTGKDGKDGNVEQQIRVLSDQAVQASLKGDASESHCNWRIFGRGGSCNGRRRRSCTTMSKAVSMGEAARQKACSAPISKSTPPKSAFAVWTDELEPQKQDRQRRRSSKEFEAAWRVIRSS